MSSVAYLREQFRKLQTDEERNLFCFKIFEAEHWTRSDEQRDIIPEGFFHALYTNLETALKEEGRSDLFNTFGEIVREVTRARLG